MCASKMGEASGAHTAAPPAAARRCCTGLGASGCVLGPSARNCWVPNGDGKGCRQTPDLGGCNLK